MLRCFNRTAALLLVGLLSAAPAWGQADDEITPQSEAALERGLEWLARNQGPEGNWGSSDLGLVSMGALAFMAAGHAPGRGKYGRELDKALDFVISRAKPSGLLNIADSQRDMYNHGLATFVLGQAHGMTTTKDRKLNRVLDSALKLIANTQCEDGGWDYKAQRQPNGHDLSLAVMQAKALRSAVDSGLEVPPEVIDLAIRSVRQYYSPKGGRNLPESEQQKLPGQFTYSKGGGGGTVAMAAAGVVCLQEFGQYDDWRIPKNMELISASIREVPRAGKPDGSMPFDAYTLYYVGQALYQVGGDPWQENYPRLRDYLIASQADGKNNPAERGAWKDHGARGGGRVGGKEGELYGTSVGCFILAIPNRYLPILQEGKIESFEQTK
ncbi:MAG: squalene--hopene cyclase [Pirellulaceae bacterium]